MMNIVYGKAGSGKTEYVNKILASLALEGCEDLLLVVPEQFSFTSERAMLSLLGPRACNRVEVVMSFSHIAETVRKEYGSRKLREVGTTEKILLMNLAISVVKDKIEFFSRRVSSRGFVSEMISISDEFKQNTLTFDDALKLSEVTESKTLRKKLREVSLILQSYDALMHNKFSDPFDTLTHLYEVLGEYKFFQNKTVVIDGFHSFSRQELRIIERMMAQAKEVYVTVCADSLYSEEEYDVFAYPRKTAKELIDIAKRHNREVKAIKVEVNEKRDSEIKFLEENIFRTDKNIYENPTESIEIISAKNIEKEAQFVALTVKKLLKESDVRCRDIAIVSRDGKDYDVEIRHALSRYGIEVFSDKRHTVKIQPLCTYILSSLQIAAYGVNEERVMKCLKTGLTDLTTEEISSLENYSLMWGRSADFSRQWTENPRGFGEEFLDEDRENLQSLNNLRKAAIEPLLKFKSKMSNAVSGKTASEEIYNLLVNINAAENLKKIAISLEEQGEQESALEQERIWAVVMNLLDIFAEVEADEVKPVKIILDLFEEIIANEEIGVLPQGLDEVLVGNAERSRVASPKYVFIVGANDGVFPRTPTLGGIFTSNERKHLLQSGMKLNSPILDRISEERFIAYHTLCSAEKKVYVSYTVSSLSGEMYPSEIVTEIRDIFPNCKFTDSEKCDIYDFPFSDLTAFELTAQTWNERNGKSNALKEFFANERKYSSQIKALSDYLSNEKIEIKNKETAVSLYGKNMFLSASRIETFYKCPFEYFCKFGLNARPLEKAEISPRQRGTVVHFCLEKLIKEYGIDTLSLMEKEELQRAISSLLNEYAEVSMGGRENKSVRFEFLFSRFEKTVYELIQQIIEEFRVSDFVPYGFEVKIDNDGDIAPYEISLADGGKISVRGMVDRVDIMEKNSQKYLRVVDYKTGGKDFKLYEVLEGINMQMLIYLFAAEQNGRGFYQNCVPAGVLYKPAKVSQMKAKRNTSKEEVESKRKKEGKYSGLVLLNEDVIYGMDKTLGGDIIGVKIEEKDEKISFTGSVVSLSHLGKLKRKVDEIIERMGNELHLGNAEILPFENGSESACKFCDYKDVCLKRDEDKVRTPSVLKNEEIFKSFDEEDENNG